MEEKNELGDIILNKNSSQGGNKKVILAAATLGVILIIVVLLMNTLNSENEENLPQTNLPPKPKTVATNVKKEEPLFEDVEVLDEATNEDDKKLEEIAKKLKSQSQEEKTLKQQEAPVVHKKVIEKQKPAPKPKKVVSNKKMYYVQVGSFTKYKPNKNFLNSITKQGYDYRFYQITSNGRKINKVLVGPFKNEREARKALKIIRKTIEKGAFLTRVKG